MVKKEGSAVYALYMAFRLKDEENAEEGSDLPNASNSHSEVILSQENMDMTEASSTGEDGFTISRLERSTPAVQAHSTPLTNAQRPPIQFPRINLPSTQTMNKNTPTYTPLTGC